MKEINLQTIQLLINHTQGKNLQFLVILYLICVVENQKTQLTVNPIIRITVLSKLFPIVNRLSIIVNL